MSQLSRFQILADGRRSKLTAHERQLFEFTSAIAEWLEPFHDHIRPSAATVLADAMKQSELKTGKPLRNIEIPTEDGSNDQKEPPQVTPPPGIVANFFDGGWLPIRVNAQIV